MPNENNASSGWPAAAKMFLIVFALVFTYAFVRYNVLGAVELIHLPLYISNKVFAVTSAVLIGLSYLMGPLAHFWPKAFGPKVRYRKYFGLFGFGTASIHAFISLLLFNPAYYPRFFLETGKLTFAGELSMLFGVLALFVFAIPAVTSLHEVMERLGGRNWLLSQRIGYIAYVLVLLHVAVMGWRGWLNSANWPGGLVPLSLISSVVIMAILLIRLLVIIAPVRKNPPLEHQV